MTQNQPARFRVVVVAWVAAVVFVPAVSARGMEIAEFDEMSAADQGRYVGMLLRGAENFLRDQGKDEIAAKIVKVFGKPETGGISQGISQLEQDIQTARQLTRKTGKAFHVEHALLVTFKKGGIDAPGLKAEMMKFGQDFKPSRGGT